MTQQLEQAQLIPILEADSLETLTGQQIFDLFAADEQLAPYAPDATFQVDPRDGAVIVYSSARARRPHDYEPPPEQPQDERPCPICEGRTTGVLDVARLSEGFTFINKNLFPILFVPDEIDATLRQPVNGDAGGASYGLHFLQWTSSLHAKDWHNMPQADRVVVVERLAALEKQLLYTSDALMPPAQPTDAGRGAQPHGYVSIIKNHGGLVGGSLPHGHQQIAFSNVMPRKVHDNWRFEQQHGERFTTYLLRENPSEFVVRDYGPAVLLVPYFMRRPYNMLLVMKDAAKQYLSELDAAEVTAVADGWHDALRAIREIMPRLGKELAFNVTVCNGPGAGLYMEFLPYTQETGGFEHLGLWVCQGNPTDVATHLREALAA